MLAKGTLMADLALEGLCPQSLDRGNAVDGNAPVLALAALEDLRVLQGHVPRSLGLLIADVTCDMYQTNATIMTYKLYACGTHIESLTRIHALTIQPTCTHNKHNPHVVLQNMHTEYTL